LNQNEFLGKKQPCFLDHTDGWILGLTNDAFFFYFDSRYLAHSLWKTKGKKG
jgi:hypothetical protein